MRKRSMVELLFFIDPDLSLVLLTKVSPVAGSGIKVTRRMDE